MGLTLLVAEGVRSYYRIQRRQEINRYTRELMDTPPVELASTTLPARAALVEAVHGALAAACPAGWSVEPGDVTTLLGPDGPRVLLELEPAGCSSKAGRSAEHVGSGVPTYWLVDPVGPSLTVLELKDGEYVENARHRGESWSTSEPFPLTLPLQA